MKYELPGGPRHSGQCKHRLRCSFPLGIALSIWGKRPRRRPDSPCMLGHLPKQHQLHPLHPLNQHSLFLMPLTISSPVKQCHQLTESRGNPSLSWSFGFPSATHQQEKTAISIANCPSISPSCKRSRLVQAHPHPSEGCRAVRLKKTSQDL